MQAGKNIPAGMIGIAEKVAFLKQPVAYPHPVSKVTVKETHMSFVFLADGFAYKLKKPVKYLLLDLRTLSSRHHNCIEEVRLNRRLAPGIYLDTVPITLQNDRLQLEGNGEPVDWLVKMKRIPEERMLNNMIKHQRLDKELLRSAALHLARFYLHEPSIPVERSWYREKLEQEIRTIYQELTRPEHELQPQQCDKITGRLERYLHSHENIFDDRVASGKIIEGHGDLRPEHICPGKQPVIIDCLEFNKRLRILDPAEELAFLYIECEVLGNASVGYLFMKIYSEVTNDDPDTSLISFYKTKRACLRAYLLARHITEPDYKDDPKWLKSANAYLALAEKYSEQLQS